MITPENDSEQAPHRSSVGTYVELYTLKIKVTYLLNSEYRAKLNGY